MGMDPYFLDKDNDLAFKLGETADWLSSSWPSDDSGRYQSHIRSALFPASDIIDSRWQPVVEQCINNEFDGLFADHAQRSVRQWDKWVHQWFAKEVWAREFVDDRQVVQNLLSTTLRMDFHQRLWELQRAVKLLVQQYQLGDVYEYHWSRLQERVTFRQLIRPSDVQFFLFRMSFSGSLKQLTALEWTRNVRESYAVNNQSSMDLPSSSLTETFV